MFKPTLSTVACPDWSLRQVAEGAERFGFEAVELRTFGDDSRRFACDPAMTCEDKTRTLFANRGIEILSLGTSCRFDATIFPPVIGFAISDTEKSVRQAKSAIDLAVRLECPYVRVFGFEIAARESAKVAMARIAGRLFKVCDHADKTGAKIVLENGGSFETAMQLRELIERVNHPLLGACYSLAAGCAADDSPIAAVAALGSRLWMARIKDVREGRPVRLGTGTLPCREFAGALGRSGFSGSLVYEWDKAWWPEIEAADEALPGVAAQLLEWGAGTASARPAAAAR